MQAEKKVLKQIDILSVMRKDVENLWPLAHFMVAEGLRHAGNTYSAEDIKQECKEGTMQLFLAFGSDDGVENKVFMVCVSRMTDHPLKRQLEVVLLSGKKRELWEDKITEYLEHIALQNDCHRISILARPGWKKLGDRWGFKIKNYEFVKELI